MQKQYNYYYNNNIELLDQNIGTYGENLSIAILTCNKSELTINLLKSINEYLRDFKGEIVLLDNNSDNIEKEILKKYLKKYPLKYKIYYSKKNLGIAGGRKKAFSLANNDWILSLDNDMYFVENPIEDINLCIDKLGARFINLSAFNADKDKRFINGGKFKISKKDFTYVTADTFDETINDRIYLSTFVFGGSSVINKYAYNLIGGYDENFFVGYEDVDFSIRCYKAGIKIANINLCCVVHNHQMMDTNSAKKYEKIRYDYDRIMNSSAYFYKKYNKKYSVLSKGEKEFLKNSLKQVKNDN